MKGLKMFKLINLFAVCLTVFVVSGASDLLAGPSMGKVACIKECKGISNKALQDSCKAKCN